MNNDKTAGFKKKPSMYPASDLAGGYVYVMSNPAMPELVKVGFTTNHPEERARQLSGTHSPHPVKVEYSVHVPRPRAVEQEVHRRLSRLKEGKEWFRCNRETAIAAVKRSVGAEAKQEFSRLEQEEEARAARLRWEEEAKKQAAERLIKEQEARALDEQQKKLWEIDEKYIQVLERTGVFLPFRIVWPVFIVLCAIGLVYGTSTPTADCWKWGAFIALFPAYHFKKWADSQWKKRAPYQTAFSQKQREIEALKGVKPTRGHTRTTPASASTLTSEPVIPLAPQKTQSLRADQENPSQNVPIQEKIVTFCPKCQKRIRLPRGKLLDVTCPHCHQVSRLMT